MQNKLYTDIRRLYLTDNVQILTLYNEIQNNIKVTVVVADAYEMS